MTNELRYQELASQAKKLRAQARRLEAKGDHFRAGELRAEVEGLRWEMLHMRENWGSY
jgi:outer membrane murein-binding lipoprotein Lpp